MYHIPEDKRAKRSAASISEALLASLRNTEFNDISVSYLTRKSGVSRSTFYRLFDNTADILAYLCDSIFEEIILGQANMSFSNATELMTFFNERMMSYDILLDALIKSKMTDILYSTNQKYLSLFLSVFKEAKKGVPPKTLDCSISILSVSLCVYITWWAKNGKKESPKELTDIVQSSFQLLSRISL
ncbi:MAG: TetR/AcrR family transcriptional regulator [Lachnospiraceae bacterium]|nr:TetR/AcrR family transcriptional regulator [Lachnospiraceae bacterium]